ncbi:MAG: 50S ribosomal protein L28 [Planctomycetaceae bacterium]|jgi:large subunit ribosomal protein L28|nr:50S ribosomal protein L28 [Planctomycetaceae bacterium]MDB4786719.1 50S ribosomal protein L28 [Planctomycetaceae bacterium]MDC0274050.1 50S ribosomal protein L28 [Planctomycetaceae bacterium]MDG2388788.1 50S ribosomal protein L28 [Planctomycetaceae bacterium]
MSQQCSICGKKPGRGHKKEERGKPKYLGGNGRKTTGITKRQFNLNLQSIRVQDGEEVVRKRVCVSCIRSGKIQKAVVRKPFTVPSH